MTRESINIMPVIGDYPIASLAFAPHVQMREITEDNWRELQRRVAVVEEMYGKLFQDEHGAGVSMATEAECRRTIGQTMNWGDLTAAEFDDEMDIRRIVAAGGFPGIWQHTTLNAPLLDGTNPVVDIYVEIDRRYGTETRRVQVHLDGRHASNEDALDDQDMPFDDHFGEPVEQQNAQSYGNISAETIHPEVFEAHWRIAEMQANDECTWPIAPEDLPEGVPVGSKVMRCGSKTRTNYHLCRKHHMLARIVAPRVFTKPERDTEPTTIRVVDPQ